MLGVALAMQMAKDQLIQREECRWRPSAEKRRSLFSIFTARPRPWPTLLINWMATLGIIVIFGLVMLFSASYTTGYLRFGDSLHFIRSQVLCLGLGVVAMALFSYIDYRFLRKLVWPGYLFCLVLLVLVLFSTPLNGCRRWISFGGFTVQVSEIAKFEMILLTAHLAAKAPAGKTGPGSNRRVPPSVWLYQRLVRELIVPLLPCCWCWRCWCWSPHVRHRADHGHRGHHPAAGRKRRHHHLGGGCYRHFSCWRHCCSTLIPSVPAEPPRRLDAGPLPDDGPDPCRACTPSVPAA